VPIAALVAKNLKVVPLLLASRAVLLNMRALLDVTCGLRFSPRKRAKDARENGKQSVERAQICAKKAK